MRTKYGLALQRSLSFSLSLSLARARGSCSRSLVRSLTTRLDHPVICISTSCVRPRPKQDGPCKLPRIPHGADGCCHPEPTRNISTPPPPAPKFEATFSACS